MLLFYDLFFRITDPNASKPNDWDENEAEFIPDPNSFKPEEWDDEEDGEWEAAHIKNPKYQGIWKAPLIPNPKYKVLFCKY